MRINEIFVSIQGEGPQSGRRSLFIRMSGCNLKCSFCDSTYATKTFFELLVDEVVEIVERAYRDGIRNIIWTGGEPLMQFKDIKDVIEKGPLGICHSVETNGTIMVPDDTFDLMVISPKEERVTTDEMLATLGKWISEYGGNKCFKPVITYENMNWWMQWAHDNPMQQIYFMPMTIQPVTDLSIRDHDMMVIRIIHAMHGYGVNGAVSPRLHVIYKVR